MTPTHRAYFDHAATSPLTAAALEAMRPWLREPGNASSIHAEGQRARAAVEASRGTIAAALGVEDDEVTFTGSGTEADNLALRGTCWGAVAGKPHVVVSAVEHDAVRRTARWLERMGHAAVTVVEPDADGVVDADAVLEAVRRDTKLVSLMLVNNETGAVQPVERVGRALAERGVRFHVDAVQALGRVSVRPKEIPADLVALSAHKVGGPKGVGVLFVRRGLKLQPIVTGGEQESGLHAGTEPVPSIVGAARAVEDAVREVEARRGRLAALTSLLERGLMALPGARLNGPRDGRAPGLVNAAFAGVPGETLVQALDLQGFAVSTGSACTSGSTRPSHVLEAMGQAPERAREAVRFSFGPDDHSADVERLLAVMPNILATAREGADFKSMGSDSRGNR